ncbi:YdcF family protein [Clostridium chrysemydis]|uniref:YdcF family protein n=1 Tax=Clostridium chrysemydis TaxID=2665504 RepID=UPI00188360EC|nr:YdcF family protein [Clostridium chrysemydis]
MLILFAILIWISTQKGEESEPSEVAIVLGCKIKSESIKRRLDLAINLYRKDKVKSIVATGRGRGSIPEYIWMEEELLKSLVKKSDIYLEKRSMNTFENLLFTREILNKNKSKRLIVCTNRFHIARVKFISKELGLKVSVVGSRERFDIKLCLRETAAFIKDYVKIKYLKCNRKLK